MCPMLYIVQAYEEEVAALQSQKQEVGKALLEREKDFKVIMTKYEELKKLFKVNAWDRGEYFPC